MYKGFVRDRPRVGLVFVFAAGVLQAVSPSRLSSTRAVMPHSRVAGEGRNNKDF